MNIFSRLLSMIRQVIRRVIPYKSIEQAERVETPLSSEMTNALDLWYNMYLDKAPWLSDTSTHSLNLPAFIASEIARQIVLEMKWNITAKKATGTGASEDTAATDDGQEPDDDESTNPRAEYLKTEFKKLVTVLREKLELGCAAGGMLIKPYPNLDDGHIYFDWNADWSFYPLAFDDDGNLSDVIIPDTFTEGRTFYTRLERHTVEKDGVRITQRAFKSNQRDTIGTEIPLTEIDRWSSLQPEALVQSSEGPLFGWYKVAASNCIDVDSPMGASVYAKAVRLIEQADIQYSRLLWEYKGSELAIDVDPTVLRPKRGESGQLEMPDLDKRLFRAVDADKGDRDLYEVFSPQIRDGNLITGLNQLLMRIEDLCGLSRGALSDANTEARTATELKIIRQRTYTTIAGNQAALENCLRNVIRAMDKYATVYNLAPEGEYDVSFEWDDSVLTDSEQQLQERLTLMNAEVISKTELRQWYLGETRAQAEAAIAAIQDEKLGQLMNLNSLEMQQQGIQGPKSEEEQEGEGLETEQTGQTGGQQASTQGQNTARRRNRPDSGQKP